MSEISTEFGEESKVARRFKNSYLHLNFKSGNPKFLRELAFIEKGGCLDEKINQKYIPVLNLFMR